MVKLIETDQVRAVQYIKVQYCLAIYKNKSVMYSGALNIHPTNMVV